MIAPAGFGKTELIARSLEVGTGRSLVLTHTHSGVSALRERLQRLGVPRDRFEVATIAGWALRYTSAYPGLSGLTVTEPTNDDWPHVYTAAIELLKRKVTRDLLERTFTGVYVDEYQDCSQPQHSIVTAVADVLPCRLLGDPLQGIFDFREPTVDWNDDVVPNFERLPDLVTPWRWLDTNPELGNWLTEVRERLIRGDSFDVRDGPVDWRQIHPAAQLGACLDAATATDGSVVAINKWAHDCHRFASRTGGVFSSMEELDCNGLMDFAEQIDGTTDGHQRAALLIQFAGTCFTGIASPLSSFQEQYSAGQVPSLSRLTTNRPVVEALNGVASSGDVRSLVAAARVLERYPGSQLYRRELWHEMKTTLGTFALGGRADLRETAWYVRDRSRRNGRRTENRVVSRTLLVKGLEFDHCVVLDADRLTVKELYVAATRGAENLTVLSASPIVSRSSATNVLD